VSDHKSNTTSDQNVHRQPRAATIVWGAILVGAALLGLRLGAPGVPLANLSVLWSVVAFGGVLVLAAIIAAILRVARR
jgi:hydrogenase/urease accessory protein HupE